MIQDEFIIELPVQNWDSGGKDMLEWLTHWKWRRPGDSKKVAIDFTQVRFIEPWAIAMLVAHALYLKAEEGCEVRAITDTSTPSNQYLVQMGIHHVLAEGSSILDSVTSEHRFAYH